MAWNTQFGTLSNEVVSEDELWSLFNYVFVGSAKKTTTYKFALIKSILDNLFNNIQTTNGQEILYTNLFKKFAESYWNLVVKYHLKQKADDTNGTISKIEQIFKETVEKNPILRNIEFNAIKLTKQNELISKVQTECKKYVLGALYGDFQGKIYGYESKGDRIILSNFAYQFMLKHKMELEKLNYYAWAKFLESINEEKILYKVITKIETSLPQRQPLDIYRKILYEEFEQNNCFYCGKKLNNDIIHVDHFIPWSFVKEDKLWNFVLSCQKCNTKKSNILPSRVLVSIIQKRNLHLIESINNNKKSKVSQEIINSHFSNYNQNTIPNLWQYAFYSGFNIDQKNTVIYKIDKDFGKIQVADSSK